MIPTLKPYKDNAHKVYTQKFIPAVSGHKVLHDGEVVDQWSPSYNIGNRSHINGTALQGPLGYINYMSIEAICAFPRAVV